MKKSSNLRVLLPICLCFYVMGFVDVVGIATSYVKSDFDLSNKVANLLPAMVFLWFAIFSFPTGALMGRIGRKRTIMFSAIITVVGMLMPLIHYNFMMCLLAFALLGIGNTILQVSVNPLIMEVAGGKEKATSLLIFGQFFKAIASTAGPVLIGFVAAYFGNWKLIFPIYATITLISWIWLFFTKIDEQPIEESQEGTLSKITALFKDPYLMMLFSIIVLSVGFEIGLITAVPKFLLERCGTPLEDSGVICSLYYISRTAGALIGAIILAKASAKKFSIITLIAVIAALCAFMNFRSELALTLTLCFTGVMFANVFGIAFSAAIQFKPERSNEISALMIMGVAGGALIPPIMGVIADMSGELMSLFVLVAIAIYLLLASMKLRIK